MFSRYAELQLFWARCFTDNNCDSGVWSPDGPQLLSFQPQLPDMSRLFGTFPQSIEPIREQLTKKSRTDATSTPRLLSAVNTATQMTGSGLPIHQSRRHPCEGRALSLHLAFPDYSTAPQSHVSNQTGKSGL